MRARTKERIIWLLRTIEATKFNGMVAWNEEKVDAFVEAFPEAEKGLIVYTMGPNSCPMLNRTAKLAEKLGYLSASSIGNMDARSFNQRTWCRYWSFTEAGRKYLEEYKNDQLTNQSNPFNN